MFIKSLIVTVAGLLVSAIGVYGMRSAVKEAEYEEVEVTEDTVTFEEIGLEDEEDAE